MALRSHLSVKLKSELYDNVVNDDQVVTVGGTSVWDDTTVVFYRYDANSSATDNGDTVIKPTAVAGNGRFLKMTKTQVQADWNSSSGLSQISNKPSLSTVATSGAYNDLSGKPTIPTNNNQLTNGSNFIDQSGARSAISLTITGSSGAATYNSSTGVLNIPQYTAPTLSFNNSPGRSITSGTGATGFQVSSTRPAMVNYSVTISTTVSLAGNTTGYVALQICATNSATAGDWIEVARTASGQSGTLVVGLTLNQTGGGNLSAVVPAGWYAKILSVNTAGTPSYTYNSGQEVLFN